MRQRSRLCVLAGLMGGMSLLAMSAPAANAANKAVGGDSIAVASANGGSGGSVVLHIQYPASGFGGGTTTGFGGGTGTSGEGIRRVMYRSLGSYTEKKSSQATITVPSGDSGSTGRTGDVHVNVSASNTAIKGKATVNPNARSGDSGDSGRTGNANAAGVAVSSANSGATSASNAQSGDTGNAVNAVKVTAVGGDGGNGGNNATAKSGKGGNAIIH